MPEVELVLKEMVTPAQLEALRSGTIDVGLIRPPATGADITSRLLMSEPLLAALPLDTGWPPPAGIRRSPTSTSERFIGYSPSEASYFYEILASEFRTAGIRPDYTQYVSQIHTMLAADDDRPYDSPSQRE